jgi:hypothetical protein
VDLRNETGALLAALDQQPPFQCTVQVVLYAKRVSPRAVFTANGRPQLSWPCGWRGSGRENSIFVNFLLNSIFVKFNFLLIFC